MLSLVQQGNTSPSTGIFTRSSTHIFFPTAALTKSDKETMSQRGGDGSNKSQV